MRITKGQLKRIIREEYTRLKNRRMLNEKAEIQLKPLLANDIEQGVGADSGEDNTFAYNSGYIGIRKGGRMYYIEVEGNRPEIEDKLKAAGFKPGDLWLSPKKINESVSRDQLRNIIRQEYRNIVRENRRRRRY